jgi:hypothetical protein
MQSPLGIIVVFVDLPSFTSLHEPLRFFIASSLKRSRSPAQVDVGIRRASKVITEQYEGLCRSKADHFSDARLRRRSCSYRDPEGIVPPTQS